MSIYGFHWLAGHAIPHHYFNSEVPLAGKESIHDYASEYESIKALAQQEMLHLAQPCVAGCEAETGSASSTKHQASSMDIACILHGYCEAEHGYCMNIGYWILQGNCI